MNYINHLFGLYPIQKVKSEGLFKGSSLESLLIAGISKELILYGLDLALPNILVPGRADNFEVYRHHISVRLTFKTLGELDENIGHIIRCYGNTKDAPTYIRDKFLMPFSEILEASDKEFASASEKHLEGINEISLLNKKEKLEIVNIQGTDKDFRIAVMEAESVYKPEDDKQLNEIWNYAVYHRLSDWIQHHKSAQSVQELVHEFNKPF